MKKSEYKHKIMNLLISDDEIAQLILNTDSNYTATVPSDLNKGRMKNENIFTYMLNPKIKTDTTSTIMMSFKFRRSSRQIKQVNIIVEIYTHFTSQQTDQGDERNDLLGERITELMDGNRDFGIGEMQLQDEMDLKPVKEDFVVSRLLFETHDFAC